MKKSCLACSAALSLAAFAGANDWENTAVNSIHRLPPRTWSVPMESETAALAADIGYGSPYMETLDGEWKFSWSGDPARAPDGFEAADADDSSWQTITVPSCVELQGYGSPVYTNIRYPHKMEWPLVRDRETGRADFNPVSCYRRRFSIPEKWRSRDVILRFEGVGSAFYVWINGRLAGYAEDSKLPSEFDITPLVDFEGENTIAVKVFRWCDGSYLEDQDMFRFSGIFRNVLLWSKPRDGIWDFRTEAKLKIENGKCEESSLSVEGIDGEWTATLYDATGSKVADFDSNRPSATIPGVRLWSAEDPYLYTLVVRKGDDIRTKKTGFKTQTIDGAVFKINSMPAKIKGVNRHETNPVSGRTVALEDMVKDVELFKKYNINAVRTSHYPNHRLWYDLCDKYGIYVIAEANVEAHEPGYGDKGLGKFPEWNDSIVERNERHVVFYRMNPSVTMWSLGNETGHGVCFSNAAAAVRAADPSRPVHWERGNDVADIDSCMYPSVEWLRKRGTQAAGLESESGGDGFASAEQSPHKPFMMCEYAHAMGNALGNFAEYWDEIYACPALMGGCVWDWADQAIWKYTDRLVDGERERYLAYGGDFDDVPNDGPFCVNGVVDPFRNVSPKLVELAHVHRNLVVRRKDGSFELENRFLFTFADSFDGKWELFEDGAPAGGGVLKVPNLAPLSCAALQVPELEKALSSTKKGVERCVNFSFSTKEDSIWAEKGWTVASDQIVLDAWKPACAEDAAPTAQWKPAAYEYSKDFLTVERARTTAIFSRRTGLLRFLSIRGIVVFNDPAAGIPAGPRLTVARAFSDNDKWMLQGEGFFSSGLSRLEYHALSMSVEGSSVRVVTDVTGAKGCGFRHSATYTILDDGSVSMANKVEPYGKMPAALPRLGLSMRLPRQFEGMRYYGRGPYENYVDRNTGSFLGIWTSRVGDQFVDYVRPQFNGGKSGVRWAEFFNSRGEGVRFCASVPMFMEASHYGWEDLFFARHRNGQERHRSPLAPREEIMLDLDVLQTGLGGASCGPGPMGKYRFDPNAAAEWTMKIEAQARK